MKPAVYPDEMGEVAVPIRLENAADRFNQRDANLAEDRVRSYEGVGVVDTGAVMLAIPRDVADLLGLQETGTVVVSLADESKLQLAKVGPVNITIVERSMIVEAVVLPAESEILIGQVVLETLDLLVDCQKRSLIPRPESPIYPSLKLK